jgi:hypothetical protein
VALLVLRCGRSNDLRKFSDDYSDCIDPEENSPRRRRRSRSKEFLIKKYSDLFELCVSAVK